MLYLVVERYRDGDPLPVYRRLRERGRRMPEGLRYVASWVTEDLGRCFQVVECEEASLVARWTREWDDLVEFEILRVVTSAEAAAAVAPRL